jgi:hypothetical protein
VTSGSEHLGPAGDSSTFSEDKTRLLEHQVSLQFFGAVLAEAQDWKLLIEKHRVYIPEKL